MLGWGFPPNVTGGLDTHVGELYTGLREADVDVELILPAEYAPDDVPGIEGVPTGGGDIITRIGRLSKRFAERAEEFDVVHTHDWFGYGPGLRAKSAADVAWVSSFHSLSADRNIVPPRREVETEQRLADRADTLISVSDLVRRDVLEKYDRDSRVVHNGFSTPQFSGTEVREELGVDGPMLFFVGRHTDQKGISHLLYAMEKLYDPNVTLVVGGTGHQTAQLKRFTRLLGVEDQVEFVGYIHERELGDFYAAADAFVSPSLAEPFGLTITEALEAGTHVIATESGVREVLPEGLLVEVEPDSESLVYGIREALSREEPPEYDRREWSEVVEETVAVYEEAT